MSGMPGGRDLSTVSFPAGRGRSGISRQELGLAFSRLFESPTCIADRQCRQGRQEMASGVAAYRGSVGDFEKCTKTAFQAPARGGWGGGRRRGSFSVVQHVIRCQFAREIRPPLTIRDSAPARQAAAYRELCSPHFLLWRGHFEPRSPHPNAYPVVISVDHSLFLLTGAPRR